MIRRFLQEQITRAKTHHLFGCLVSLTPLATTTDAQQQLDYGLHLTKHAAIAAEAAQALRV